MFKEVASKAKVAIIAIMILEIVALLKGVNGLLLLTAVGVISGLGGYIVMADLAEIIKLYYK